MYAKTLVPGAALAAPTLTGTTSVMDELLPQLLAHGWAPYGADLLRPPTTTLELDLQQNLRLVVSGQVILDGLNPIAPPGWWEACQAIGGFCVAVVLRTREVDLSDPLVGTTMRELMDKPGSGAWGIVELNHSI